MFIALRNLGRETSEAIHSRINNSRCSKCMATTDHKANHVLNSPHPIDEKDSAAEIYCKRGQRSNNKLFFSSDGTSERACKDSLSSVHVVDHNSVLDNSMSAAGLPPNKSICNSDSIHSGEKSLRINSHHQNKTKEQHFKLSRCNGNNKLENNLNQITENVEFYNKNVTEYLDNPISNIESDDIEPPNIPRKKRPDTLNVGKNCRSLPPNQQIPSHDQKVKSWRLYNGSIGMSCLKSQSPEHVLESRRRPLRYYCFSYILGIFLMIIPS